MKEEPDRPGIAAGTKGKARGASEGLLAPGGNLMSERLAALPDILLSLLSFIIERRATNMGINIFRRLEWCFDYYY